MAFVNDNEANYHNGFKKHPRKNIIHVKEAKQDERRPEFAVSWQNPASNDI